MSQQRSSGAVGFTMFAGVMMILIGAFHAIAGLSGIIKDNFYTVTPNYILFSGAVWARTVGVILAGVSALISFAWIPLYPIWAIIFIAVDVTIIWALTVHGRDITME